jgi:hypothetical protein
MASSCGILFDKDALGRASISLAAEPSSVEASPAERAFDDADSAQPLYDSLTGFSLWPLGEIFPQTWSVQDAQGAWHRKFGSVNTNYARVLAVLLLVRQIPSGEGPYGRRSEAQFSLHGERTNG